MGRNPSRKETSAGDVVNFSVAVTTDYGGEGNESTTEWCDVAIVVARRRSAYAIAT